ncbi:MAG TPA: hypothetical protein VFQ53_31290 [Kofleriaceae bacterium]|nr:hypothetical protein [Kofleriaceae bacterium]
MARNRRGRGTSKPTEIRGTLGTLLRTTTSVVRDAIERGAREGRTRIDEVRTSRRRQEALAELGELVLDLIRNGEIDVNELPEAQDLVRRLDELDADEFDADGNVAHPPLRRRFDERTTGQFRAASLEDAADDGTVSSLKPTTAPPHRAGKPTSVWRPPTAAVPDPDKPVAAKPARDPARKGGIHFEPDSDDDLADYMHPDDVPPKPTPEGDS